MGWCGPQVREARRANDKAKADAAKAKSASESADAKAGEIQTQLEEILIQQQQAKDQIT